ncbi:hypothetical protein D3C72_1681080 [compost metagenome]
MRREVRAARCRNFTRAGGVGSTSLSPTTSTVSKRRLPNGSVPTEKPPELNTGPPCSDSRWTLYSGSPSERLANSSTVETARFSAWKPG